MSTSGLPKRVKAPSVVSLLTWLRFEESCTLILVHKAGDRLLLRFIAVPVKWKRGKSGQYRAPYFLTGRSLTREGWGTESAAERKTTMIRPSLRHGKGEKVR